MPTYIFILFTILTTASGKHILTTLRTLIRQERSTLARASIFSLKVLPSAWKNLARFSGMAHECTRAGLRLVSSTYGKE